MPGGFFDFVRSLIPENKYKTFLSLFRFPTSTSALSDEIFGTLEKVFDGRDKVITREFITEGQREDFIDYMTTKLGGTDRWQKLACEAMKTAFNSVVVCDLKEEQDDDRPAPYYYLLRPDQLVDFRQIGDTEEFEWVAFWQDAEQTRLAVYSTEEYAVYEVERKHTGLQIKGILVDNPHDLQRCPVYPFWHTSLNGHPFLRKGPLTVNLGEFDHLLKDIGFTRHLKLYAGNPVWSGLKTTCDFEDTEHGYYCDGGSLRDIDSGDYLRSRQSNTLMECPSCNSQDFAGPGTYIEVDPPSPDNGKVDLRNPVQVLEVGVAGLEFNITDVERQERKLYMAVTGNSMEVMDDQAINEKQVQSLFESGTAALIKLKPNLELTHQWIEKTVAELRYGPGAVVEISIDYGTQFFLLTADALLDLYKTCREKKMSHVILDALEDQYFETKYRHNPRELLRAQLVANIDPCRHLTTTDAQTLYRDAVLPLEDYAIKANFSSLLMRFERENVPLIEFGVGIDFDTRVERIRESLLGYVTDQQSTIQTARESAAEGDPNNNNLGGGGPPQGGAPAPGNSSPSIPS